MNKLIDNIFLKILHLKYTYNCFFAHHPLCNNYRIYTYKFGNVYVCKGCFHTYSTFLLTFILCLIFEFFNISYIRYIYTNSLSIFITLSMLIPLIVDFFHIKVPRWLKNIFRSMLGYSISSVLFSIMYSPPIIKTISIFIPIIVYILLRITKNASKYDVCGNCDEFNEDKICSGMALQYEKEIKFSKTAGDYLQKKYYN